MFYFILAVVVCAVTIFTRFTKPEPVHEDVLLVLCRLENRVHALESRANRKLRKSMSDEM